MSPKSAPRRRSTSLLQGKEGLRFAILIILMIVLGAVFFGVLDALYSTKTSDEKHPIDDAPLEVQLPPLRRELLAKVKDDTPLQRLSHESDPYEHLLDSARYILPGVLRTMGLRDTPNTVDEIRKNPERFRGRPVSFEGEVFELLPSTPIPGMPKYRKTEGKLDVNGEKVHFAVISKIPDDLKLGRDARIEGFFFKLRDFKFPESLSKVPHVVGFELKHAFGTFEAVKELDPKVLAEINDATKRPDQLPSKPLYHLASYVKNRPKTDTWKKSAPSLRYEDVESILKTDGKVPRGKDFRVLGELYTLQIKLAEPNPLGIRYWTRAWVKHKYAETIQVNIPGRVAGGWNTGDFVVFYGSFFKRHFYEGGIDEKTQRRSQNIVPLFIADDLYHWELRDNPANLWIKLTLTTITLLLIGLLGLLVFRDSRADQEVRERILERRKRRRTGSSGS